MITASFTGREGIGRALQPRLNLGAMTASAAAHALVVALLVITWRDETLAEGGTGSALVSIDFAAQEGGPGPTTTARFEANEATPPLIAQAQERPDLPAPRPLPSPSPSAPAEAMRAERAGGGEGRTGQGTGAVPMQSAPAVTPVSARGSAASSAPLLAVAAVPPQRGQGQDRSTDQHGTGGSGGERSGLDGNSAVSNYKGHVYQHLLRYRQTNTIGSGKVLVAFVVEPDGAARNVSVARSSGSSRFDREAVQLVRRAVPLPSPPDGASHSFTFEIAGQ